MEFKEKKKTDIKKRKRKKKTFSVDWANLDAVFLGRRCRLKCPEKLKSTNFLVFSKMEFLSCWTQICYNLYFEISDECLWKFLDDWWWVCWNHVGLSDKFAGFSFLCGLIWKFFMLIGVLVKRVYGLKTWGLWVLCISRNWFEWVCLIFIEFSHSLVLSWCFGLEGIWFQNLGFVGFEY